MLDAYRAAGGNFIDTADSYSAFVPGNEGGESETIIGNWLAGRGDRDELVIATKVGAWERHKGLGRETILAACDDSLRRLRTDVIDLYWAHFDDADTPLEETWGAFDELVEAGKVRRLGISNYEPDRLRDSLELVEREGWAPIVAMQPHYNLVERDYERERRPIAEEHGLACIPYFGLAKGFLAGKYRPQDAEGTDQSPRAGSAREYLERDSGPRVLEALDTVAAAHDVPVPAVSLAWLRAQPTVASAIASARTVEQLEGLLPMAGLELSAAELDALSAASA